MDMNRESFKAEVERFRASFKEDIFALADKAVRLEQKENIGWIVFDAPNSKANTLSTPVMLRIYQLVEEIERNKSIEAVVLISRKPTIFIAGADISEIQKLTETKDAKDSLMKLQAIFNAVEALPVPTIAAIHGACMGGGTELSLSCDYRIATDAKETKMALPEVQLGVIPGWGGTQRMPRLIGLERSLDLILSGRAIDGKTAKKYGLVDYVCPLEWLEKRAFEIAKEKAKAKQKRQAANKKDLKETLLESIPGRWLVFEQARKKLLEKTKGNYPAPLKALEVIRKTFGGSLREGLKIEAQAFAELLNTPECKNLIRLYYLNEKVKKTKGSEAVPRSVIQVGVLGAGVMGGGIAQLFVAKGIRSRLKDIQFEAVTKGTAVAYKIFKKQLDRRKLKQSDVDNAMALLEGTVRYSGFKNLDLVVEAVVEDLEIKRKVFQELETKVGDKTAIASNTSSLSIETMSGYFRKPERFFGLHFFNPVEKMPLVEIIRSSKTSEETIATAFQLAKKLGKTPILVKDSPGFVVNRILCPYLLEAVHLMIEGVRPKRMDDLLEKFGMPMGPCELLDEIGIDVASKVLKVLYGAFGKRMEPPPILDTILSEKRLGKKSARGIYLYEGKNKTEDTVLLGKIAKGTASSIDDETIIKRLIYIMINEAARVVDEQIVKDVSDIDVGMIFGTGFAPFRGGLLRYADSVGLESVASSLDLLARNVSDRFTPASYLQEMATSKGRFYQ